MRARPLVSPRLVAAALLLASPDASADFSDYCTAFFDDLEASFSTDVVRTFSDEGIDATLASVEYVPDGKIAGYELDAAAAAATPGSIPFTVAGGSRLALCVDGAWQPPATELSPGSALALARPVWGSDAQTKEAGGVTAFLSSVGGVGLVIQDARVALDTLASTEAASLMVLQNSDGLNAVTGLEVTGTTSSDFTLVRQWETDSAPTFGGTFTLTDLRWEEAQAGAAIYRAVCGAYAASNDGCSEVASSDLTLTLAGATVIGTASEAQQGPLVSVAGDLVVSGSTLRDLDFTDPALEATGAVTLDKGTALLGLGSAEQAVPAVKAGGDLQANTALFSDLSGWKSIARADQRLRVEQSYVCGVSDTDHLVEAGTFAAAEAEVVTTAVLQSRFYESLVSASTASNLTAKLANLTLLGVQTPFESAPSVDLLDANSGSIEIRSLLSADSVFQTWNDHTAADVWLWSSDPGQDCRDARIIAGCTELDEAPAFTGSESLLSDSGVQACRDGNALLLADLMQAESRADQGEEDPESVATLEEQIQALAGQLPALLPGQTDLIGTAGAWNGEREWKTACVGAEGGDIGAYSGPDAATCSLSFLAPFVPSTEDTGDSGAGGDGGTDGTDATDGSASADSAPPDAADPLDNDAVPFGLGSGCRYGSAGALAVMPLLLALRRRRGRHAHRATPPAAR